MAEPAIGWNWFEAGAAAPDERPEAELCRAFARCFAGPDGQTVINHVTRSILDRRLPPSASDAELRHLEGQRCAVAALLAMIERGRA